AGSQKAAAEQTGLEIGGAVLAKPINKQLESTLGLNLAVTSQYDSTRNISVPKVTLSRKLSEKFKVSGSRSVGDVEGYDVKLEYLLNNNITAVGSYENKNLYENTTIQNTPQELENVFGLDLEFKREFK
ncbi:MAG TPA: translocation/assembly module TamB domain-containing protein, partial [Bdellovibrio sp.]|nr:translocation/assembly module TamB domain-containing protein [Bdellovibrio sp.]